MKKYFILAAVFLAVSSSKTFAEQITTVGSSTVYPFATVAAEQFGKVTKYKTPVIESTGTGGGMKLFCNGVGKKHPDLTNASRAIKKSEVAKCKANGVTPIEVMLGYDGIVLANSKDGVKLSLTRDQLYRATAREVWDGKKFVANPYKKWSDIDASLPNIAIEVMGPPPTSGTRDAYVELVQHKACKKLGIKKKGPDGYKTRCSAVREDGAYIEGGENDNLIIQKLKGQTTRYGIFGFSFLDSNLDSIQGALIDGVAPTFEGIASGDYPVSRSLFFYVKKEHLDVVPALKDYVMFFVSKRIIGQDGAAVEKGLIPLQPKPYNKLITRLKKELN